MRLDCRRLETIIILFRNWNVYRKLFVIRSLAIAINHRSSAIANPVETTEQRNSTQAIEILLLNTVATLMWVVKNMIQIFEETNRLDRTIMQNGTAAKGSLSLFDKTNKCSINGFPPPTTIIIVRLFRRLMHSFAYESIVATDWLHFF